MAVRLLKVSSVATAVFASSGFYLYNKNVEFNDLSIVRFGRAAATTAVISYDYLTALQGLQYGTEEYWAVKSKCEFAEVSKSLTNPHGAFAQQIRLRRGLIPHDFPQRSETSSS